MSFIEYITNMMIRKHLSRSNMSIGFSQFYVYVTNKDSEYQRLAVDCKRLTRILVSTQCYRVLLWLVAVHHKFTSFVFSFDEFLCDVSTGSENIASGVRDLFHFALKKRQKKREKDCIVMIDN